MRGRRSAGGGGDDERYESEKGGAEQGDREPERTDPPTAELTEKLTSTGAAGFPRGHQQCRDARPQPPITASAMATGSGSGIAWWEAPRAVDQLGMR